MHVCMYVCMYVCMHMGLLLQLFCSPDTSPDASSASAKNVCMHVPKNRKHLSRCFWIGILIIGTDAQVFSCPQGTLNASRPSGVEVYEV